MTAPYDPKVIAVPGVGQEIAQGLAPFINAMQFQQQLAQQQQQAEQEEAARMLAILLKQPGAENSDIMKQLEGKLGVPGLGASIAQARETEKKATVIAVNEFVEGLSGYKSKPALRGALIAGNVYNAPAEMQNSLFLALGGEVSEIEKARLEHLQWQSEKIELEIAKMRREPGPQDQLRAAQLLNVSPSEFVEGFDYIGVLEDRMKQKETDPRRVIINTSTAMMTQRDFIGRAKLIPEEAFEAALRQVKALFPETVGKIKLTPEITQALEATDKATQVWTDITDNDNQYVEVDAKGAKKVVEKLPTRKARRAFVERGVKALYPLLTEQQRNDILDIVGRRVEEGRLGIF